MHRPFSRMSPALLLLAAAVRAQEPDLAVTIRALGGADEVRPAADRGQARRAHPH